VSPALNNRSARLRDRILRPRTAAAARVSLDGCGRAATETVTAPASASAPAAAPRRRPAPFAAAVALSALGLAVCSAVDALSRATLNPSIWFFWLGVALIVAPLVHRLCAAEASVGERVALVCLVGVELYVVKLMREPFGYTMPDEFFHAYNAQQIARHHDLFRPDPSLPVTTRYPGLEGATSALMALSGMSSFGAGIIVVGAARLALMLGLMTLFFAVSRSWQVAGLGAAAYAGNSNFLLWGAQFSYESLALPLMVVALALVAQHAPRVKLGLPRWGWALSIVVIVLTVVITHHLTSYLLDAVLLALAVLPLIARRFTDQAAWPFAVVALLATAVWLALVASQTVGYISPVVGHALIQTVQTVFGESAVHAPFQAGPGGAPTPLGERLLGFASLVLLAVGVAGGLLPAWRRHRRHVLGFLFCLAALAFFAVLGLRLAPSAWEVANRTNEVLFVGMAFVVGYAVIALAVEGRGRRHPRIAPLTVAAASAVLVVGSAITGWPTDAILPAPTRIRADGRSIDSETIALGRWVGAHLRGQTFAAPQSDARTILLYGDSPAATGPSASASQIVTSATLGGWELPTLRRNRIRFVVVDNRVRADDTSLGYAFSVRPAGGMPDRLLPVGVATKFEDLPAPRVFDSGNIAVFDLQGIS
jgi:hypothetical protein